MGDIAFANKEKKLDLWGMQLNEETRQDKDLFADYQTSMTEVSEDERFVAAERTYKEPTTFVEKWKSTFKKNYTPPMKDISEEELTVVREKKFTEYNSEKRREKERNFLKERAEAQMTQVKANSSLYRALSKQANGYRRDKRDNGFEKESQDLRSQMQAYKDVIDSGQDQDGIAETNLRFLEKQTGGSLVVNSKIEQSQNYHVCAPSLREEKIRQKKVEEERRRQEEENRREAQEAEKEKNVVSKWFKKSGNKVKKFFNTDIKNAFEDTFQKVKKESERILDDAEYTFTDNMDLGYDNRDESVLFPHSPCLSDISQFATGDCYLLSAVSTVIQKDPDYLRGMMIEKKDTVVVRLYDNAGNPQYFEVTKNVSQKGARGPLWVQMIEKAFCFLRLSQMKDVKEEDRLATEMYIEKGDTKIADGGSSREALRALTGVRAKFTHVGGLDRKRAGKFVTLKMTMIQMEKQREGEKGNGIDNDLIKQMPYSGVYDTEAIQTKNDIEAALKAKKLVTTQTFDFQPLTGLMDDMKQEQDHNVLDNMVGNHAYAVLGMETRVAENIYGQKYEAVFIKLHNPWGMIRRTLKKGAGMSTEDNGDYDDLKEADSGVIEMELNDFMMYSDGYSIGDFKTK